jgi:hypothetical protein
MEVTLKFDTPESAELFTKMMFKVYDLEMQGGRLEKAHLAVKVRKQILEQLGVQDEVKEYH